MWSALFIAFRQPLAPDQASTTGCNAHCNPEPKSDAVQQALMWKHQLVMLATQANAA
eukprot:CAMPEP_0172918072 /NCGR_PEP_ID=MMETSP1075-20121228/199452_1 /TAXON_ID=2916 /ORGANISM="Ceratium fusus, Strain PA161109" /LENGTH=56 /DNA_ID=CAMNT_0013777647 /DNA_START=55 /DNA_END=221 /DNA_ORIENTATION=+